MGERPIIFSAPMVRALLDGRKTQTRRVLGARGRHNIFAPGEWTDDYVLNPGNAGWRERNTPYKVGDRLWVREAFSGPYALAKLRPSAWSSFDWDGGFWYWADGSPSDGDWTRPKPSIHMPRWASRLTLVVSDVQVQRLQDISEEGARAEGATCTTCANVVAPAEGFPSYRSGFGIVWNGIHGDGAWDRNEWVAALTFTVEHRNIDAPASEAAHA